MPTTATSSAAFAAMKKSGALAASRREIFAAAIKFRRGFTREDLKKATGIDGEKVNPRTRELILSGAFKKTGKVRKNKATGNMIEVLEVCPEHRANWAQIKRKKLI